MAVEQRAEEGLLSSVHKMRLAGVWAKSSCPADLAASAHGEPKFNARPANLGSPSLGSASSTPGSSLPPAPDAVGPKPGWRAMRFKLRRRPVVNQPARRHGCVAGSHAGFGDVRYGPTRSSTSGTWLTARPYEGQALVVLVRPPGVRLPCPDETPPVWCCDRRRPSRGLQ